MLWRTELRWAAYKVQYLVKVDAFFRKRKKTHLGKMYTQENLVLRKIVDLFTAKLAELKH